VADLCFKLVELLEHFLHFVVHLLVHVQEVEVFLHLLRPLGLLFEQLELLQEVGVGIFVLGCRLANTFLVEGIVEVVLVFACLKFSLGESGWAVTSIGFMRFYIV